MLLCERDGTLLEVDSDKQAVVCSLCGASKSFKELATTRNTYSCTSEAFLQGYGVEPMLPDGTRVSTLQADARRERATVDEKCISCGHKGLSFYTMQMRSADEGQTVFFDCPQCKCVSCEPQHNRPTATCLVCYTDPPGGQACMVCQPVTTLPGRAAAPWYLLPFHWVTSAGRQARRRGSPSWCTRRG